MSRCDKLQRAQGYRVETRNDALGSVAAVLPRVGGEPGYLLVHASGERCRLTTIPFAEVEQVDSDARRVVLRGLAETMREAAPHGAGDQIVPRT